MVENCKGTYCSTSVVDILSLFKCNYVYIYNGTPNRRNGVNGAT